MVSLTSSRSSTSFLCWEAPKLEAKLESPKRSRGAEPPPPFALMPGRLLKCCPLHRGLRGPQQPGLPWTRQQEMQGSGEPLWRTSKLRSFDPSSVFYQQQEISASPRLWLNCHKPHPWQALEGFAPQQGCRVGGAGSCSPCG